MKSEIKEMKNLHYICIRRYIRNFIKLLSQTPYNSLLACTALWAAEYLHITIYIRDDE